MSISLTEQNVYGVYQSNLVYWKVASMIRVRSIYGAYFFSESLLSHQDIIHSFLNQTRLHIYTQVFQIGQLRPGYGKKWWTMDLERIDQLIAMGIAVGDLEYTADPRTTDITKLYVKKCVEK